MSPEQTEKLIKDVAEIKTALLGMPEHDIEGLVSKVKRHEKHVQKSKTRAAWFTGIASGIGFGIHQIIDFFKH